MDLRRLDRAFRLIPKACHFAFCVTFVLLVLNGCSQNSGSRIHVELHDVPEANLPAQTVSKPEPPSCPPGDPLGNDASSTPAGGRKVMLSWNASTSANGANAKDIFYCLYRTKGGPVRANTAGTTSPCVNCERVTEKSIAGTQQLDIQVENGAHYCYVAIAIDRTTGKLSFFSNQADAVIPPNTERPFCNLKDGNPKQANGQKPAGQH